MIGLKPWEGKVGMTMKKTGREGRGGGKGRRYKICNGELKEGEKKADEEKKSNEKKIHFNEFEWPTDGSETETVMVAPQTKHPRLFGRPDK